MSDKIPGTLNRVTMSTQLEGDSSQFVPDRPLIPLASGKHNVVTSLVPTPTGLMHAPVLDIDIPHTLVPSSTPGKGHLYLDVLMTWEDYVDLLRILAKVGVIEPGYYRASERKGFSAARLPWVKKYIEGGEADVA